jgi:glycosyltransferase involved in cell wall biosynthesis
LFSSSKGIAAGARLLADKLRQSGFDVRCCDIGAFFRASGEVRYQFSIPESMIERDEPGVAIFVVQPPEFQAVLAILGTRRLTRRYVIAYWAWELTKVPNEWQDALRFVDELWVQSSFVASVICSATQRPVRVVPYPLTEPRSIATVSRKRLGLSEDSILTFFMFDPNSTLERKNPYGVIKAFQHAASGSRPCELLIKVTSTRKRSKEVDRLCEFCSQDPRIHFICDILDHSEVLGLIQMADIVMSLHRSEGFGLLMAEAMLLNKPVIATGWSGNLDFMSTHNSLLVGSRLVRPSANRIYDVPEAMWAEPDLDEASMFLRELIENDLRRRELGEQAGLSIRDWIRAINWEERFGEQYLHYATRTESRSAPVP